MVVVVVVVVVVVAVVVVDDVVVVAVVVVAVYLFIFLSICLSARLFSETASIFELDSIGSAAFLRDFLIFLRRVYFFRIFCFSVWSSFPCYLLLFGAKICVLHAFWS